ncbi:hypothetical protein K661_03125 [Piscirickettsia salmonis LF-89 = ATCC VR-1361]|nr:hypothetical protein K661_03125 [Piscirickettsia salmonis LF-89 = ATCC VR-1361]
MLSNYFSLKIMSYSSDYVEFSKAFLKLPTQEASFKNYKDKKCRKNQESQEI